MGSLELRWGVIIGLVNLVWLYLSFYLGMHTHGLTWIQVMGLVSVILSFIGYVLGLRAISRKYPEMTFSEGLKSGVRIAGVVAVFAMIAQFGYFYLVHPDWTDYMVEETGKYYSAQGVTGADLEEYKLGAKTTFGLRSYLIQSVIGALFVGVITSLITVAILQRKRR